MGFECSFQLSCLFIISITSHYSETGNESGTGGGEARLNVGKGAAASGQSLSVMTGSSWLGHPPAALTPPFL